MDQLVRGGFVLSDDLAIEPAEGHLLIIGKVLCQGGMYVDVRKRLRILPEYEDDLYVQTVDYTYNVVLAGVGNVFRYDSPHFDHNREHHRHEYDVLNGDKQGTVELDYADGNWPTLREVVEEAAEWYFANLTSLQEMGFVSAG